MRFFATFSSIGFLSAEIIIETEFYPEFFARRNDLRGNGEVVMMNDFVYFLTQPFHRILALEDPTIRTTAGCLLNIDGSPQIGATFEDGLVLPSGEVAVPMGFGSRFLDQYRSVMLIRDAGDRREGRMILSPSNPASFCSGPIAYLPVIGDDIFATSAALSVNGSLADTRSNAPIILYSESWASSFPREWREPITFAIESVANTNFLWDDQHEFFNFPQSLCANGLISRLPTLTFTINENVELLLFPENYMRESDCALMIHFHEHEEIVFGNSFVSDIAFIFDADYQRVGFCDA